MPMLSRRHALLLALSPALPLQAQDLAPGAGLSRERWPGLLRVEVDATDVARRVFQVRQRLSVTPGLLTLRLPRWLPGYHWPEGDAARLAGLMVQTAAGQRLRWRRQPLDTLAFDVQVPEGVAELQLQFQFLGAHSPEAGRVTITPELLAVHWETLVLYPGGRSSDAILCEAAVKLPEGWAVAGALRDAAGREPEPDGEGWRRYAPVSLEQLVDSPLFAGRHYKRFELEAPGATRPVALHVFAEEREELAATPEQIAAHARLVQQADKLFGVRHFDHYDFLLMISRRYTPHGLEHHESSENSVGLGYFKDWAKHLSHRGLLPHEYVHSWCGKFRRPADLLTANFDVPMQDSLLWVYEGMTNYWGDMLTVRSGLATPEQARDRLAREAAVLDARRGRLWRDLQDTTNAPVVEVRPHLDWPSWQRSADYYPEGTLLWLDADTLIRELSGGRRSLEDFARRFFAGPGGRPVPKAFDFDEVVATLQAVQPHHWAVWLRGHLEDHGPGAPLNGLLRGGWRLVWSDTPSESELADDAEPGREVTDLGFSLGLVLGKEGVIDEVLWDSPAFRAGLAPQLRVMAVNQLAYSPERLIDAIKARQGLELLLRDGERFRSVSLDYREGLRYPRLERLPSVPDRLSQIYAAKR